MSHGAIHAAASGVKPGQPAAGGAATDDMVNLGRMLYFEPRLSKSQKISCNSCHDLAKYGVEVAASLGWLLWDVPYEQQYELALSSKASIEAWRFSSPYISPRAGPGPDACPIAPCKSSQCIILGIVSWNWGS